jgi:hypothetical protein
MQLLPGVCGIEKSLVEVAETLETQVDSLQYSMEASLYVGGKSFGNEAGTRGKDATSVDGSKQKLLNGRHTCKVKSITVHKDDTPDDHQITSMLHEPVYIQGLSTNLEFNGEEVTVLGSEDGRRVHVQLVGTEKRLKINRRNLYHASGIRWDSHKYPNVARLLPTANDLGRLFSTESSGRDSVLIEEIRTEPQLHHDEMRSFVTADLVCAPPRRFYEINFAEAKSNAKSSCALSFAREAGSNRIDDERLSQEHDMVEMPDPDLCSANLQVDADSCCSLSPDLEIPLLRVLTGSLEGTLINPIGTTWSSYDNHVDEQDPVRMHMMFGAPATRYV